MTGLPGSEYSTMGADRTMTRSAIPFSNYAMWIAAWERASSGVNWSDGRCLSCSKSHSRHSKSHRSPGSGLQLGHGVNSVTETPKTFLGLLKSLKIAPQFLETFYHTITHIDRKLERYICHALVWFGGNTLQNKQMDQFGIHINAHQPKLCMHEIFITMSYFKVSLMFVAYETYACKFKLFVPNASL